MDDYISFADAKKLQPRLTKYLVHKAFESGDLTDYREKPGANLRLSRSEVDAWSPRRGRPEQAKGLLSIEEACAYIGMSRSPLERKRKSGELSSSVIEGRRYFDPVELDSCFGIVEHNDLQLSMLNALVEREEL